MLPAAEGHGDKRESAGLVNDGPSGPTPRGARRVLIVDDNEDVRHILGIRLQSAGFDVSGAADGEEGLEKVRQQTWDLVVLDLVMPRMDGFEFLTALKQMPGSTPPVVVITQRDDAETRQRVLALGAAQHVPKGHAFSREFVSTLRRWTAPPPMTASESKPPAEPVPPAAALQAEPPVTAAVRASAEARAAGAPQEAERSEEARTAEGEAEPEPAGERTAGSEETGEPAPVHGEEPEDRG